MCPRLVASLRWGQLRLTARASPAARRVEAARTVRARAALCLQIPRRCNKCGVRGQSGVSGAGAEYHPTPAHCLQAVTSAQIEIGNRDTSRYLWALSWPCTSGMEKRRLWSLCLSSNIYGLDRNRIFDIVNCVSFWPQEQPKQGA